MLIVKVGQLIDGTGAEPMRDAALAIEGERIVGIAPAQAMARDDAEVIDLGDATVLPGLVDAHCHLMFEPASDHETVRAILASDDEYHGVLRAARNAQLALLAGITTLRDCGGRGFATLALRDAVNNGTITGPRIIAAGPAITTTRGHLHYLGMEADSTDELIKAGRQVIKAGADYVKVCVTGGNMTPGSNAYLPQYDVKALTALVEDAHRLGRRVAGHAHGAAGIRVAVEAGIDYIEHCSWAREDGQTDYDRGAVERIVDKGLWIDCTFPGVQRLLLPVSPEDEEGLSQLRANVAVFRQMMREGLPCIVSSDNGVRNTRFEEFAQTVEVAVVGCQLSPMQAIGLATREPAKALGLGQEIGTLEAGKVADLVVVDGNPLADIRALRNVKAVMRGGRMVAWQGRLAPNQTVN
jgi:imidazolonepropionase-like amidohydrolase